MSRVSTTTLHFMVHADSNDSAFQSGTNNPIEGQIRLPPGLVDQLRGQPGKRWKTACGLGLNKPDLDGMTLVADLVNCEKCVEYIAKNGR